MGAKVQSHRLEAVGSNARLLRVLRRKWFEGRFRQDEAKYLVPLLLEAYLAAELGEPLTKKTAMAAMGADDIKTARKYTSMAESEGYLTASRAPEDRRKENLHPTDLLRGLVEEDLRHALEEVCDALSEAGPTHERSATARGTDHRQSKAKVHASEVKRYGRFVRPPDYLERFGDVVSIIDRLPANDVVAIESATSGSMYDPSIRREVELNNVNAEIAANPNRPDLYVRRAFKHEAFGDFAAAADDFSAAIRLEPTNSLYYDYRAYFRFRQHSYIDAISDYTHMLEILPRDARTLANRGLCFLNIREYEKAIADFSRSIKLHPRMFAFFHRSLAFGRQGNFSAAIEDCTQVLAIDNRNFDALAHRGACFYQMGDYDLAVLDFSDAIQLKANAAKAWNGRALAHLALSDHAHALSDADTAVELDGISSDVRATRGEVLLAMGRYEDAMRDISYALRCDPESHRYNELVEAAQSLKDRRPEAS